MAVTAEEGPLVTFGQAVAPPNSSNPNVGPNMWYMGDAIMDPRAQYTYQPGDRGGRPVYGWGTSTAIPIADQAPSTASTTNIVNAQTPTAGTALTLVSSSAAGITVGCAITSASTGLAVTGLLGIDVNSATNTQVPVIFGTGGTGAGGSQTLWNPLWALGRCLILTTNGDDTAGTYVISGYDIYMFPMTQTLTGVNNSTVSTTKAFKYITSITPAGTIASTSVSVGTTDTFGLPLRTDRFPYLSVWWGTPQSFISGGTVANQYVLTFPVTLSTLANTQIIEADVPFDGSIISAAFRVTAPATTSGKAATLTVQANGVSVTGGVLSLTSANMTPTGNKVSATSITAGNTFTAGQTVGVVVSSVTAFVEGSGVLEITVQNADDSGGTFVAAVTTSPATATTGDVRGTFAVPSVSDGTKRLTIFWTPIPANLTTVAGLVGVTQV